MNEPKKEIDMSEWPNEKVLLLKLAEVQFSFHRIILAGVELLKNSRNGSKATMNVKKSDLAALKVELQRAAQIKWPVRKKSWWKRFLWGREKQDGPPQNRTT